MSQDVRARRRSGDSLLTPAERRAIGRIRTLLAETEAQLGHLERNMAANRYVGRERLQHPEWTARQYSDRTRWELIDHRVAEILSITRRRCRALAAERRREQQP